MESRSVKMAKHHLYLEEFHKIHQANQYTDLGTGCWLPALNLSCVASFH